MAVYPYIRVDPTTPPIEEQRSRLAANSDREPTIDLNPPALRDFLIASLGPQDAVMVLEPSLLGATVGDAKAALQRILQTGAAVVSIDPPLQLSAAPASQTLAFLDAISLGMQRTRRKHTDGKPGRKGVPADRLAEARAAWLDLGNDKEAVARRFGVNWRTLYRLFGPRVPNP